MYTYTYYDNVQAGPDDIPVRGVDSKREVEPQITIQHLGLQPNIHQTASQITPETKGKTKEGTGEIMRSTTLKSLLFHVKMNSIADYYDIPARAQRFKIFSTLPGLLMISLSLFGKF